MSILELNREDEEILGTPLPDYSARFYTNYLLKYVRTEI